MPSKKIAAQSRLAKLTKRGINAQQKAVDGVLELGEVLLEGKEFFPKTNMSGSRFERPGYKEWVTASFSLTPKHANVFIRTFKKFGAAGVPSGLSFASLQILGREGTPAEVVSEVFDRAASGEIIGRPTVRKMIAQKKRPTPQQARADARSTGKPVEASDGNIYLGATKEEEAENDRRIATVYGLKNAVEAIANIGLTPKDFVGLAALHERWWEKDQWALKSASEFLKNLVEETTV